MRLLLLLTSMVLAGVVESASTSPLSDKEITEARRIYVAKCAKCHKFYEPKSYDEEAWDRWMTSMSRKSKLKTEQEVVLRKYLDEYRAGNIEKIPRR